ncbi:MAG: Ig-like domain-containing protein [Planctomycetota bacterium]
MLAQLRELSSRILARKKKELKKRKRRMGRTMLLEQLHARTVLNAAPIAVGDPWYDTPENASLVVNSFNQTLLDNDWDAEGSPLHASVVSGPSNGSLSTFNADGTFTYMPDFGFSGFDSFTYKVNDGTDDSAAVEVSISVGGMFGPRTNLEESPRESLLLTGGLQLSEPLTPGLQLVYQSNTIPEPIVVLESSLSSNGFPPNEIDAQLTFDGTIGQSYSYSAMNLFGSSDFRLALQADATSLETGRYDYSIDLSAQSFFGASTQTYKGSQNIVNRSDASHPFGRGWHLAGLDSLAVAEDGVLWVQSDGTSLWFGADGNGGYVAASGDLSFSTLVPNPDATFTLTNKFGISSDFDASGALTSITDRNGNQTTFGYSSGLLTSVIDPFSRITNLGYTNGKLTSVTDFAGRTSSLSYDAFGRLSSITQPDPDGTGPSKAPVTSFAYDADSHRLTGRTNALSDTTTYAYGPSHGRLTRITHTDGTDIDLIAMQTIGLPTSDFNNSLAAPSSEGNLTDERGYDSTFRTDHFGNVTHWTDQLGNALVNERNINGQTIRVTSPDPDGNGPAESSVSILGYDNFGNLVYQEDAESAILKLSYKPSTHELETVTNALGDISSFTYDNNGNLLTSTDTAAFATSFGYNALGLVTSMTTADPDGSGPKTAATTIYEYDGFSRLDKIINPDS